jgi:O-antigen/teichoic acid export membrane protein
MQRVVKPSKLRTGIVLSLSSRLYAAALGLVFVPFYIRFLGIEAYGLYGFLSSFLALVTLLDLGFANSLAHALARAKATNPGEQLRDLVRSIELPFLGITVVVPGLLLIAAPWIVRGGWIDTALPIPVIVHATMLIIVIIACNLLSGFYSGGLAGLERQVPLNVIQVLGATIRYFGAVLVLWKIDTSIEAFLSWVAVSSALQVVATKVALRVSLPRSSRAPRFQPELLRTIWRFTAGVGGITIAVALMQQSGKIILGSLIPLDQFAQYAIAAVITINISAVSYTIFNATFARISYLFAHGDHASIVDVFHKSSQVVAILVLPATTTIALFPTEVLTVWIGDRELAVNATEILRILVVSATINCLTLTPYIILLAAGKSGVIFRIYLAAALAIGGLTFLLGTALGAVGAAVADLVCYIGAFLAMTVVAVHRLVPTALFRWLTVDVLQSLITASAVPLLARAMIPHDSSRAVLVFALAAVWFVSTFACAFNTPWFRREFHRHLRRHDDDRSVATRWR